MNYGYIFYPDDEFGWNVSEEDLIIGIEFGECEKTCYSLCNNMPLGVFPPYTDCSTVTGYDDRFDGFTVVGYPKEGGIGNYLY